MRIQGKYKIVYENGFKQQKNLISNKDYLEIVRPLSNIAATLEIDKKTRSEARSLKKVISSLFGEEWFTDESPLFNAIKTGTLSLPESQGGNHKVKITKI